MFRLLGDSIDGSNPSAPECSISGCSCGPALMVASGMADMALGADHLAGIRVNYKRSTTPAPGHLWSLQALFV